MSTGPISKRRGGFVEDVWQTCSSMCLLLNPLKKQPRLPVSATEFLLIPGKLSWRLLKKKNGDLNFTCLKMLSVLLYFQRIRWQYIKLGGSGLSMM